ncbi:uncharacterized protein CcaverHIS019_0510990 [Cutaneotrichosporon cavernicola]|uniref:Spt20-like SEP domain-containing protein n=1 Tax=Cutaneotrichosporon cavernicola TaxID=279322 RepID=A0AA48L7F5_9TREE|nr:uncharacterized protein CcaverHIS019_0510990 [Cutaneotrichosporon cavernicola]BEI93471.1 hypothetical protein CcaverHIS019_0510990 [Cutaneotrichosporon cavernicola]BEJ01250.1 hypothetical protein CcaverHIS631_0511070 [Cutaneotrichosporon cavernicola]BEJ09018.1 hypothetical protein CcaverHIS641_0511120 [Cutaneotrichosporon cavernicola]
MASASGYNYHRFARALLKKSRKWEPSLSIQLYQSYWRFENSDINFLYDGPMKPFLLALRAQVIPAALIPFLYDIRPPVSFVDGCLVVEIQDFRKTPEVRSRVVMRPAPETLPLTIDIMLGRRAEVWDEAMTLELESRVMAATSAPLYLGTSPLAARNAALSLALTAPANPSTGADGAPRSSQAQGEEEDSEQEALRKLLATGSNGRAFQPNWSVIRVLDRIANLRKEKEREAAARAAGNGNKEEKKKPKKKRPAEEEKVEEKKEPPKKKKKTAAAKEKEAREAKLREEREAREKEEREKAEKEKGKKKKKKKDEEPAPAAADKPKSKKKKKEESDKEEEEKKKPTPKKKKKVAAKEEGK